MRASIQKFLPYGYLYLVVLGVIKESIFYYPLDINILKYSSIMDILISPIADITSYPILILFFVFLGFVLYFFKHYLLKNLDKKSVRKFLRIEDDESLHLKAINHQADTTLIAIFFALLMCFFLGFGIGGGYKLADRIAHGTLNFKKNSQTLHFNSGEAKTVYVIDHNSMYYFYVEKDKKSIEICPLASIKTIEKK